MTDNKETAQRLKIIKQLNDLEQRVALTEKRLHTICDAIEGLGKAGLIHHKAIAQIQRTLEIIND